jgi:DNA-nicking Smr family endonuclease
MARDATDTQRSPPMRGLGDRAAAYDSLRALTELRETLAQQARQARERERLAREAAERERRETLLFAEAVADATQLPPANRAELRRPAPPATSLQRQLDEQAVLAESLSDDIDIERYLDTDDSLSWRRPGIGPDAVRKLRRGEWVIGGQIDLHGLRVDEAREALVVFLGRAIRDEIRCVRIIHGKGLGSIGREPVLKRKVPRWLAQREEVLAFCQARPNDGGAGALVVLLRIARRQP